jgi:molybdopterin synthase sulfur carrier subunit
MPNVKFFAGLRSATGIKETSVSADSVRRLLDILVDTYPPLGEKLWDGAAIRPHVVITINGHPLDPMLGPDIPVQSEDEVAIFPPIAGG